MKAFLIGIFLIGAILIGIVVNVFAKELQPALSSDKTPVIFDVPKGASFNEITDNLYSMGLIRSKVVFKIYAFFKGAAHRLQNGRYRFDYPVSVPELLDILLSGPKDILVLISPGMTFKEIDDRLSQGGIIKKGDLTNYENLEKIKNIYGFLAEANSLEGFLFPDTYKFRQNSDIETVIAKFLDNFENKVIPVIEPTDYSYKPGWGVDKKNDGVLKLLIIASYLEKEIPDNEERKVVAGIIEKRLKIGMPLQIDATVLYNKCFGRFSGCSPLVRSDLKKDSAYNTYTRRGLTPTPIANPSLEAIKAAINKKDSNYFFYLSDPKTKKTIFSENLENHNINRVKYLLNNK